MPASARQQIRHSSLYIFIVLINYALPLLTLPIFTRLLTPEDYGLISVSAMYGVFVSTVVNFGLLPVYQRNFFEVQNNKGGVLLFSLLLFVTVLFLVVFIISSLFAQKLSLFVFKTDGYAGLFLLQAVAFFFNGINQYFMCYLQNDQQARRLSTYSIMTLFLSTGLSFIFVWYGHAGVWGMIAATVFAEGATCAILSYKILRAIGFGFDMTVLLKSLRLAMPLTFNMITKVFMRHFDKYMINALNSIGQAGVYNIAEKISQISFSLMTALDQVYIPVIYKHMFESKEAGGKVIGPYLTPFFYISMLLCLIVSLFSKEILMLLTPIAYHHSANIVVILSMYYAILFFTKHLQLIFAKKTHLLTGLFLFNALLNVLLNLILIPRLGAMGAALAALLSGIFLVALHFYFSQQAYRIYWEYHKIIPVLMYMLFASISIIYVNSAIPLVWGLLIKGAILIAFLLVGKYIGVITKETIQLIVHSLTKRIK